MRLVIDDEIAEGINRLNLKRNGELIGLGDELVQRKRMKAEMMREWGGKEYGEKDREKDERRNEKQVNEMKKKNTKRRLVTRRRKCRKEKGIRGGKDKLWEVPIQYGHGDEEKRMKWEMLAEGSGGCPTTVTRGL